MDNDNRYAPPKAVVEGTLSEHATAPPLWNPNAAANWCLLFSPVFGAWLHWKNWQMLGDHQRASSARNWLVAAVVVLIVSLGIAMAADVGGRALNFVFLLAWYFAAAKPQARLVKERYGDRYPRRGWLAPIGIAVGTIVILAIGVMGLALLLGARA